jgi:hypothetical protein
MQPTGTLSADLAGDDDVERARRAHEASKILGIGWDKVLAFIREQEQLNVSAVSISDPSSIAQDESVVDPPCPPQLWKVISPSNSQESDPFSHNSLLSHISDANLGQALVSTEVPSLQLHHIEQDRLPVQQHESSKQLQPSHQSSMVPLDPSSDNPSNAFGFDLASYPSIYALSGPQAYSSGFGDSSVKASLHCDSTTAASGGYNGVTSIASGVEDTLNSSALDSTGNTTTFDVPAHHTSQVYFPNLSVQRFDGSGLSSQERSMYPKNVAIPTESHFETSFDLHDDVSKTTSIVPNTDFTDSDSNFLGSIANQSQVSLYAVAQSTPLASSPHPQLAPSDIQHTNGRRMVKSAGLSLASPPYPRNLSDMAPIAPKRKANTPDLLNSENTAGHIAKATTQKKHRGTYTVEDLLETNMTRELKSCIRCHRQRVRVGRLHTLSTWNRC